MTAIEPASSGYECACGEVFPNDTAAYRHRDRQPAGQKPKHIISRIRHDSPIPEPTPIRPKTADPAVPVVAGVTWEDPPPAKTGRNANTIDADVLAALKANPGRWAKVRTWPTKSSAHSAATRITKKKVHGPGWECASRLLPAGAGSVLYMRWVGQ